MKELAAKYPPRCYGADFSINIKDKLIIFLDKHIISFLFFFPLLRFSYHSFFFQNTMSQHKQIIEQQTGLMHALGDKGITWTRYLPISHLHNSSLVYQSTIYLILNHETETIKNR